MNPRNDSAKLGTFAGVFTPSVLTILGIILFLRTGYVVGRTGLAVTLLIIGLSGLIALLTAMSLSAIATNMRVKGGGDYYLISRTLGVEYGGAIGLVLFAAQTLSIAFYCFGFGEALAALLPATPYASPRIIAAALLAILFVFAWLGADWASRLQLLIMLILVAALASFFVGGYREFDAGTLAANWSAPADALAFWAAFALFFPAMTGFTQGVSMSGDLESPERSLPLGTFAAVGVSLVVYVSAAVVFAASLPADVLGDDYQAMGRIAIVGALISAGVMAATASSAMASYLGGPRILQALASDRIFPALAPFAKGTRGDNNPRRAVLLASGIALTVVVIGDLNAVAPIVAMFFLISYGLLNYATWFVVRASSPNFRPRFRLYHEYLSLAGAVGCFGAMIAIDPAAAGIGLALMFAVHQYLKRTYGGRRFSDSQRAYRFQRVRELLIEMQDDEPSARDWRPQILVLSKDRERRRRVLGFASWIEGQSGIVSAVSIIDKQGEGMAEAEDVRKTLSEDIDDSGVDAFPLVLRASSFRSGMEMLLQAYGVGPIKANIVLLNWLEEAPGPDRERDERVVGRNMAEALRLGCNIVALSGSDDAFNRIEEADPDELSINVWWEGSDTSHLSLVLAHLMRRTRPWHDAAIIVHAQGASGDEQRTRRRLEKVMAELRIQAEINVVEASLDGELLASIADEASVTFVPIRLKGDRPLDITDDPLSAVESSGSIVALVLAGEDIDLGETDDENDGQGGDDPAGRKNDT